MAFPTRPNIAYSYSEFADGLGDGSFPGSQVDNDLANLENSANTIIDFLGTTFRTDGQLTNGSVKPEALSSSITLGLAPPRLWVTGTTYAVNDSVFQGVQYYICLVAHTAGTFSTDLSAGKWALLADFTALVTDEGLDPTLSAFAAVTTAANKLIYATGVDEFATTDFTAAARDLLDDANASAMLTTLGLSNFGKSLVDDASGSAALTTLGVTDFAKTILDDVDLPAVRATLGLLVYATAVATASGTAFDFTGIPATAKRITVLFNGVSLSGTDDILVQIGDSGGVETSSYTSGSGSAVVSNSGFIVRAGSNTRVVIGAMVIQNFSGNTWISTHNVHNEVNVNFAGAGVKELSATLDRVRITRTGTNTFDAGNVTVCWE